MSKPPKKITIKGRDEVLGPGIAKFIELKEKLDLLATHKSVKNITLKAHPFVVAFLKNGFPSFQMKWSFKNRVILYLEDDNSGSLLSYTFLDHLGKKILI